MRPFPDPVATAALRLPEALYHGTSTRYLDQILRDGLEPCHMTGAVLMACYADDRDLAAYHAVEMADFEDAEPVLFRLPADRFDATKFTVDDKFIELLPSGGRGVFACGLMGEEAWQAAPWTWLSMLRIGGSVGYTGTIPVTADDLVQGVDWPGIGDA